MQLPPKHRSLMSQERIQKPRRKPEQAAEQQPAASPQRSEEDIDSLLAEIDAVLETNAEEFVKGYVQKGGQ